MKKIVLLMLVFSLMLSVVACFDTEETTTTTKKSTTTSTTTSTTVTTTGNGENPPIEDVLPDCCKSVEGFNEMIIVTLKNSYSYTVYYKKIIDSEYTKLDDELIIEGDDETTAYILGLSKGNYMVKVEFEGKTSEDCGSFIVRDIDVYEQDRSGYAHFGATEGVGAYNNDGTVKEGTKIIYVTNENKNTVTCVINGETYTGLVNILQAQYKSDTPMLVRIIGKITTNQWNYKNVEPRLSDGSNATDDFFENTFSNEYGENLANLIVKMKGNGGGAKTYNYRTTPEGLTEVRLTNSGSSTTSYKGSDFPNLKGKSVYDDDSYYNMLEVKGSKNITTKEIECILRIACKCQVLNFNAAALFKSDTKLEDLCICTNTFNCDIL